MIKTTNHLEQADGDSTGLSAVDLARVTLHAARKAAKKRGDIEARTPRRRQQRVVRRVGREPSGVAAVLHGLMAERAWELPVAGGTVLDRWHEIAATVSPLLPAHVEAVAFHPETGQLSLRPDSPAYGTQLRLITARIVAAANEMVRTDAVRTIRILAVVAAPLPRTTEHAPAASAAPPVKTPEMACPGYQAALAAHRAVAHQRRIDLAIAEAVERQTRAMRELSRQAFPEPDPVPDDAPASIEQARTQRRREAAASEAAALRRARAERAARPAGTQTAVPQQPAALRTKA